MVTFRNQLHQFIMRTPSEILLISVCLYFLQMCLLKRILGGGFQLDHVNVRCEFGFHFLVSCIRQICV